MLALAIADQDARTPPDLSENTDIERRSFAHGMFHHSISTSPVTTNTALDSK